MKLVSLHKNYKRLIDKAIKGDRKSQHYIFELFAPKMLSVSRQYIKDVSLAEEVMLRAFFKVFTQLDRFKDEGSFEGWIRRIVINESLSELRKTNNLKFEEEKVLENSLHATTFIETSFEVDALQSLIDELPEGYKTVFVLYVVEGYKHSEIAEMLKISENTSKSQLFKARKMLQQKINSEKSNQYGTT